MKTDALFDASFERSADEEGAWLYSDPEVHECGTIWLMFYGFNLYELDNYLQEDGWDYVFTTWGRSPLSDMTLAAVIKRMNERAAPGTQYLDTDGRAISPHGFRSSFRVWAAEEPNHPKDVAEFALAHKLPDPVEATYQRSTLFEARKSLMQSWDDWVTKGK